MQQTLQKVEIMSLSVSKLRFIIDENVRSELYVFLKEFSDVKLAPKGSPDKKIADISKSEKRILVTNDKDFSDSKLYSNKLYSVIILKIPQAESSLLLQLFSEHVLKYPFSSFKGKLFELQKSGLHRVF